MELLDLDHLVPIFEGEPSTNLTRQLDYDVRLR
jgi:hypothetical protein